MLIQGFLRGPDEKTKGIKFCVLAQKLTWQGQSGAETWASKELASVPENLPPLLSEKTGVISPETAVCSVCTALEIPCVLPKSNIA